MQTTINLKCLTWNVYLGGDISKVIGAKPKILPRRVQQLWHTVQETDFKRRAAKIAAVIAEQSPDVVALQEVFRWTTIERRGLQRPTQQVQYDFLQLLQHELTAVGCEYFVAVQANGVDVVLPLHENLDLQLQDSVVLLLKVQPSDSPLANLSWENARQARFTENQRSTIDDEPFHISRGWAGVDLRLGDAALRVVTTHMEYFGEEVKQQQVMDLLHVAAGVSGPRIILGDFNSRPSSNAAELFRQNGYKDAWSKFTSSDGFTSAMAEDLRNEDASDHLERIDWILYRGKISVLSAKKLGNRPEDRLANGQWPSDHAAVMATLSINLDERRVRTELEAPADEDIEVVRRLFERFMQLDITGAAEYFHSDAKLVFPGNPDILPWAGEYRGAHFQRFAQLVLDNVQYREYRVQNIWHNGNRVTVTSTERCLVKANGRHFDNELVALVKVDKGLITEFIEYSDTGCMERALLDQDD